MRRKYMLLVVLLMVVGFAAVSTTLFINGSTSIAPNLSDFHVYYSDAYVNYSKDTSVIKTDTSIEFSTDLSSIGDDYILEYDVTNGSKNYDAKLTMNCTAGNDYVSVSNSFDTSTNLEALGTRRGTLTLELKKSYIGEKLEVQITCTLDAEAVERQTLAEEVDDNMISFTIDGVEYESEVGWDWSTWIDSQYQPSTLSFVPCDCGAIAGDTGHLYNKTTGLDVNWSDPIEDGGTYSVATLFHCTPQDI